MFTHASACQERPEISASDGSDGEASDTRKHSSGGDSDADEIRDVDHVFLGLSVSDKHAAHTQRQDSQTQTRRTAAAVAAAGG